MHDVTAPGGTAHVDLDSFDLAAGYADARKRLSEFVTKVRDAKEVAVPACPGWSVHDVCAHLVAIAEDVVAGKLTRPPSDEVTAEQVSRRSQVPTSKVLEDWASAAHGMEQLLGAARVWPAFLDVLAHEHDIRGALGQPGDRGGKDVRAASEWLISVWGPPKPVRVSVGSAEFTCGGDGDGGDSDLALRTTPFEAFRFRLGRRSVSQMRSMEWSGDPEEVLDEMTIFGPEPYDVVE